MRGDGYTYQRGRRWWIGYYVGGELRREPGGATKTEARAKLRAIHTARREGTYLAPDQRQATVDDLLDDLVTHLRNKGRASVDKVASHLRAVRAELGSVRAIALDTAMLEAYQARRLAAGKAPATINRECEALRQAFRRAATVTPPRIARAPYIPLLPVQNARQGFLERADFEAVLAAISDPDVADFVEWFWRTGMRPNEIRQLSWEMLDRETWTLNLDPRAAKTGTGRVIPAVGPLRSVIERRIAKRRLDSRLIFHRTSKGRAGQPVKDYRRAWAAACAAAGLVAGRVPGGVTPYDLRRCAVRNLVRGGTHETVAMKITGHKTRSTFDRYNIASVEDLTAAIERTTAYVATLPATRAGGRKGIR
jgi:integrase